MKTSPVIRLLFLISTLLIAPISEARHFRQLLPINSPESNDLYLPEGTEAILTPNKVERAVVENAISQIVGQWNSNDLEALISTDFSDKSRLLAAMDNVVPRDAKMQVLSIQGIQILQQYIQAQDDGSPDQIVSVVSVTAKTQIEFNSSNGYVRLPGTNEYIIQISVNES